MQLLNLESTGDVRPWTVSRVILQSITMCKEGPTDASRPEPAVAVVLALGVASENVEFLENNGFALFATKAKRRRLWLVKSNSRFSLAVVHLSSFISRGHPFKSIMYSFFYVYDSL